ncbi:MAG: hypothetical protein FJZ12_04955 [Candidatus Omnitrophica bacterium]|nr:hypothetical protein [Candidatus Omnitrophota bacterium]
MEQFFKNRLVVILSILSVSLLVINIGSCVGSYSQNSLRKKEMAQRIQAEEKLMAFSSEKASLADRLKAKEKELDEERVAFQATKSALLQEQLVCQTLKEELQKVTKVKEALETDLKKALADLKKARK